MLPNSIAGQSLLNINLQKRGVNNDKNYSFFAPTLRQYAACNWRTF